jgi:hypothetical protein
MSEIRIDVLSWLMAAQDSQSAFCEMKGLIFGLADNTHFGCVDRLLHRPEVAGQTTGTFAIFRVGTSTA